MADTESRFVGTIVGCAVGDALGAPFEGRPGSYMPSSEKLLGGFEKIRGYPLGQYTDDTQMTLAIADSLIETGAFDAEDIARRFADLWQGGEIVGAGAACSEGVANFISGIPADRSGAPVGRAGNGTAMRASPVGLWFHKDIEASVEASSAQSAITHLDPRAAAGAAAVSTAVAIFADGKETGREDFLKTVSTSAARYSEEFAGFIMDLSEKMDSDQRDVPLWISSAGLPNGAGRPEGITPFVIPTVLASLYSLLRHPDDWGDAVTSVIGYGGDVDTTGAIVGAMAGAKLGIEAVPKHLVETLKDSEKILAKAEKLHKRIIDKI